MYTPSSSSIDIGLSETGAGKKSTLIGRSLLSFWLLKSACSYSAKNWKSKFRIVDFHTKFKSYIGRSDQDLDLIFHFPIGLA